MRSFWKVAAFRLTESIRILSGRRALRCFQNELHHFIILNLKGYKIQLEILAAGFATSFPLQVNFKDRKEGARYPGVRRASSDSSANASPICLEARTQGSRVSIRKSRTFLRISSAISCSTGS